MFDDFVAAIGSPELTRVAEHWRAAAGARAMPGWSDIRPSKIAAQLPMVWSYKYDPVTEEFTGRLAGERITRMFGKDFRGAPMAHLQPAADFPWVYALCKRVVMEPALYLGTGLMYRHLDCYGKGERIMLPLSSDRETADGLIGATEYRLESGEPNRSNPPVQQTEQWFALHK